MVEPEGCRFAGTRSYRRRVRRRRRFAPVLDVTDLVIIGLCAAISQGSRGGARQNAARSGAGAATPKRRPWDAAGGIAHDFNNLRPSSWLQLPVAASGSDIPARACSHRDDRRASPSSPAPGRQPQADPRTLAALNTVFTERRPSSTADRASIELVFPRGDPCLVEVDRGRSSRCSHLVSTRDAMPDGAGHGRERPQSTSTSGLRRHPREPRARSDVRITGTGGHGPDTRSDFEPSAPPGAGKHRLAGDVTHRAHSAAAFARPRAGWAHLHVTPREPRYRGATSHCNLPPRECTRPAPGRRRARGADAAQQVLETRHVVRARYGPPTVRIAEHHSASTV